MPMKHTETLHDCVYPFLCTFKSDSSAGEGNKRVLPCSPTRYGARCSYGALRGWTTTPFLQFYLLRAWNDDRHIYGHEPLLFELDFYHLNAELFLSR